MKKYSWMILGLVFAGCKEPEYYKNLREQKEKATINSSFYCSTILHDEHLFIMSNYGYFIHHIDCPCLKNKPVEPSNEPPKLPLIIEFNSLKGLK